MPDAATFGGSDTGAVLDPPPVAGSLAVVGLGPGDARHRTPAAVEAESREKKRGREAAIQAAVDYWYKGEVAEKIVSPGASSSSV